MSLVATTLNAKKFADDLSNQLKSKGWEVEIPSYESFAEFVVKNGHSDRRIFIEIKDAKEYGELPISSILPIADAVRNNSKDRVVLVSFSEISTLLLSKLKGLKVFPLVKPSFDQVVQEVGMALAS